MVELEGKRDETIKDGLRCMAHEKGRVVSVR